MDPTAGMTIRYQYVLCVIALIILLFAGNGTQLGGTSGSSATRAFAEFYSWIFLNLIGTLCLLIVAITSVKAWETLSLKGRRFIVMAFVLIGISIVNNTVDLFVGTPPVTVKPNPVTKEITNHVNYNVSYKGDGYALGQIQKPNGVTASFEATKNRVEFTELGSSSTSYWREQQIPEYIDLTWHVTYNDVIPDERRYAVRLPIQSSLSKNNQNLFSKPYAESGYHYQLHCDLHLINDNIQFSWQFSSYRNSWNPFYYVWPSLMGLLYSSPIKDIVEAGGPMTKLADVTGNAPRLSDAERETITINNKLTRGFKWKLKNTDELTTKDVTWMTEYLEKGANVEGLNYYEKALNNHRPAFTPIMLAAGNGQPEHIKLLIKYGADINAVNANGDTALIYAVFAKRTENVKALLQHGANPEIKNNEQLTALSYAKQHGFKPIIDILKKKSMKHAR